MYAVIIRTIILYLLIIVGLRIMGKRQIGELQPSEFVVTILVSNIATLPIQDVNVPLSGGILPILTIVCAEVFISAAAMKSKTARKIFSGSPKMIIRDGKLDQQLLSDLRFSIDDLMEQLRINNIFDIDDVLFAIVETTGSLSIYPKFAARAPSAKVLGIEEDNYSDAPPTVLISDGTVVKEGLTYCNLKEAWLENIIKENGCTSQDIFLMTCNRKAQYSIIRKEKK